jgi:hypothetical protein
MKPEYFKNFVLKRDRSSRQTGRGVYQPPPLPEDLSLREWRILVDWLMDYEDISEAVRVFRVEAPAGSSPPAGLGMSAEAWSGAVHRTMEMVNRVANTSCFKPGERLLDWLAMAFLSPPVETEPVAGKINDHLENHLTKFMDVLTKAAKAALYSNFTSLWQEMSLPSWAEEPLETAEMVVNELIRMWRAASPILAERQGEV